VKLTNRYQAAFRFERTILVSVGRKKMFFNFINYELERNSSKVGENGLLSSDLAMFQFPVILPIVTDMGKALF